MVGHVSTLIAHTVQEELQCDGVGIFQLNGAAAGQTVFHYHMHVIPRMAGDDLQIHSRAPGDPAELEAMADEAQQTRLFHAQRRLGEPMPMPTDIAVIDLMLAVPGEDSSQFYEWIKPMLMDKESHEMFKMPAQYMFKDIPANREAGRLHCLHPGADGQTQY